MYSKGKSMARKCFRQLMLAKMDLVILLLIQVQANDLTSTSLHPSSLPIPLLHPYELDNMPLYDFISLKLETCEEWYKRVHIGLLVGCVIESYDTCFGGCKIQAEDLVWRATHEGDLVWKIARSGINHCYNKHRDHEIRSSPFEIK